MIWTLFILQAWLVSLMATGSESGPFSDDISLRGESVPAENGKLEAQNCRNTIYSCSDCRTALICRPLPNGTFVVLQLVPCPKKNSYCQYATGTCGASPDKSCGKPDPYFTCTKEGYFPDSKDCSIYHACDTGLKSSMFKCADKAYDTRAESCSGDPINSCAGKPPIDCTKVPAGRKTPLLKDSRFFGYCGNGGVILVDRCDGKYQLNATSQMCGPACDSDGAVADNTDCTKFYKCTVINVSNGIRVPILEGGSCPKGQGFDPVHSMCADLTTLPNCKPKYLLQ